MAGDGRARAASAPSAVALMAASDSGLSEYVVQALKEGDRGFVEPPRGLLACVCGGRSAEEMRQRRLKVACAALGALPLPLLLSRSMTVPRSLPRAGSSTSLSRHFACNHSANSRHD